MFKNVAGQKLVVYAYDPATGLPKTGDAANITAYVSKDHGAVTVLGDTGATEMDATNAKGYYLFDLTQGETNADTLTFSGKSSTASVVVVGSPATVFTRPPNFSSLSVDGSGRVDLIKIAGTTQTARDIGASVLLSAGTGTGQLDFTTGVVKGNMVQIVGTAPTEGGAGRLAVAFTKFFDKASPTGTINSLPDAVAGAAGGLFIAGVNAATTVTTSFTTTFTGSLTGNVGGNVVGTIGVISDGGIHAASFAANSLTAAALAADAVTEIVTGVFAGTFDGVAFSKLGEMLIAFVNGKVSVSSAGGVDTYTFKKRDGATTSFTSLCSDDDGTRATTGGLS